MKHFVVLIIAILSAPSLAQYQRALPGYEYEFPRDHGIHTDFRTEWWYYTGNVSTGDGRPFGYELTIFRNTLAAPGSDVPDSPLSANQLYVGHFAISDIQDEEHDSWERIGRPGLGQASGSAERLAITLGPWSVTMADDETMTIRANQDGNAIDFTLTPVKPLVLHGQDGVHQKSNLPGQASHYITYTRLHTEGEITWQGETFQVSGLSWMDHEFGSDQLSATQAGWDWFALQLDNGSDIMVYGLREKDGSMTPESSGSYVGPDGNHVELKSDEWTKEITGEWRSPHSDAVYPMGWVLTFPGYEGRLVVEPTFEDQEMLTEGSTGTTYWEGAVLISGTWRGEQVTGKGYVELVGYASEFTQLSAAE